MECQNCRRANLPGGVRCLYCGTHFAGVLPAAPDFDLGGGATPSGPPAAWALAFDLPQPDNPATPRPAPARLYGAGKRGIAGLVSSLAILLLNLKTFLAVLSIGKILLTFSTMIVSIIAYSRIYGWSLAVGFVVCIFIHEMGHVVVNWKRGIPQTAPMFIPFVGAMIMIKRFPDNPTYEAECGAGGPVAGAVAAFICYMIALATGSPYWYTLAFLGFAINLWNLTPFWQLDGAHMVAAFSPRVWSVSLLTMTLWALRVPSKFLWLLILVGFVVRLTHQDTGRYRLAAPKARARVAALYVLLAISLGWGADHTMQFRPTYDPAHPVASQQAPAQPIKVSAGTPPASSTDTITPGSAAASERTGDDSLGMGSLPQAIAGLLGFGPSAARTPAGVRLFAAGFLSAFGALLWWWAAALTASVSREQNRGKDTGRIVLVMAGVCFALMLCLQTLVVPAAAGFAAIGAYFAAAFGALLYGYYSQYRGRAMRRTPDTYSALGAGMLASAACGALLVGWATGNLIVFVAVALIASVYYLRHPWQILGIRSEIAAQMGDIEKSASLLEQAARDAESRDPSGAASLWQNASRLFHRLEYWERALVACDRYSEMSRQIAFVPDAVTYASGLERRATALMFLGRYDEALDCCAQMLQVASRPDIPQFVGPLLNFAVHRSIARLAILRTWFDEASAQAIWCLRHVAKPAKILRIELHLIQAEALAGMATGASLEQARLAVTAAAPGSQDPDTQALAATLLAQIALLEHDSPNARREAERAARLVPGSLRTRYWLARALAATGAGDDSLRRLAAAFPSEYWCRRAALSFSRG